MEDDKLTILLAEDNPGDVRLVKEALDEMSFSVNLHIVYDGIEVMDFLYRRGDYVDAPRPDLIFLDLNMPRKNGHQILCEIKADESLRSIQIVILTSSESDADIEKCANMHADCYITKPADMDQFTTVIKTIAGFWRTAMKLPRG